LSALRHGLDTLSDAADSRAYLPCSLFAAHPKEAFAASEPFWASTLDLPALDNEFECAADQLRKTAPANRLPFLMATLKRVESAHLGLVHHPDGTMWSSASYAVRASAAEAILAPQ